MRCLRPVIWGKLPRHISRPGSNNGKPMQSEALRDLVVRVLEDMKARDVHILDVRDKTSITDIMVVASGTSDRHVRAMAEAVAFQAKLAGAQILGSEGVQEGEWALIDLTDVVVHLMLPAVRDYYHLERLWSVDRPKVGRLGRAAP